MKHPIERRALIGKRLLTALLIETLVFLQVMPALAVPELAPGANGTDTFEVTGGGTTWTIQRTGGTELSNKDWLEYNSFSIGEANSVTINDLTGNVSVHKVTTGNASSLLGTLNANGTIYLINPNGILFGATARVNVGGLVAAAMNSAELNVFEGASGDITFVSGAQIAATNLAYFIGSSLVGTNLVSLTSPKKLFGEVGTSDALNRVVLGEAGDGSISLEVKSAGNAKFEAKGASLTITNLNLGGSGDFKTSHSLILTNGTVNVSDSLVLYAMANLTNWNTIQAGGDVDLWSLMGEMANYADISSGGSNSFWGTMNIHNEGNLSGDTGVNLTTLGDVENSGSLVSSGGDINLYAGYSIISSGAITASVGNVMMESDLGGITNSGGITAQTLTFFAQEGNADLSGLDAVGTLAGMAAGNVAVAGSNITIGTVGTYTGLTSGASMGITGSTITATADISATNNVTMQSTGAMMLGGGYLTAQEGNISLTSTGDSISTTATQFEASNGTLTMAAADSVFFGGSMQGAATAGAISISAVTNAIIRAPLTSITGDVAIVAGAVTLEQMGRVISTNNVRVEATNGAFSSVSTTPISAASNVTLMATGGITNQGTITAGLSVSITGASITNGARMYATNNITLTATNGSIDSSRNLVAGGDMTLKATDRISLLGSTMTNYAYRVGGDLSLTASAITLEPRFYVGNATLAATNGNLHFIPDNRGLDNCLIGTGAVHATASGLITNLIVRTIGDVTLTAGQIYAGSIESTNGNIRMNATNGFLNSWVTKAGGDIELTATGAANISHWVRAGGNVTVTGASVRSYKHPNGLVYADFKAASNVTVTATSGGIDLITNVVAGGNIQLSAVSNVLVRGVPAGGDSLYSSNGNITVTGAAITLRNTVTARNGDIVMQATNGAFAVSNNMTAGGDMTVTGTGGIVLGGTNYVAGGALTMATAPEKGIAARTNVTLQGSTVGLSNSLTSPGSIVIAATNGAMTLRGAVTATNDVTLSASGEVALWSNVTAQAGNLTATGASVFTAPFAAVSAGSNVWMAATNGNLNVGGIVTATNDVTLFAADHLELYSNSVTAHAGSIYVTGASNLNIAVTAALTAGSNVWVTATDGALHVKSSVTASNDITLSGPGEVSLWSNNVTAHAGSITVTGAAVGTYGDAVLTAGSNVWLVATNDQLFVEGSVTATNDVTLSSVGDAGTLVIGPVTAHEGNLSVTGKLVMAYAAAALTAGSNVWVTATDGILEVQSTLTAGNDVAISGTKTVLLSSNVTAQAGNLSVTGATVQIAGAAEATLGDIVIHATNGGFVVSNTLTAGRNLEVTAKDAVSVQGTPNVGSNITLTGASVGISNSLAVAGSLTVAATNGSIRTEDTLSATNNIELSASNNIFLSNNVTAHQGNLSVTGAYVEASAATTLYGSNVWVTATQSFARVDGHIEAANDITLSAPNGQASLGGNATAHAGSLTVMGEGIYIQGGTALTAGSNVWIEAKTGELTVEPSILATNDVTLSALDGQISIYSNVTAHLGNITITGIGVHATPTAALTAGSNVWIEVPMAHITVEGPVTAGNDITLFSQEGGIAIYGSLTAQGNITATGSNVHSFSRGTLTAGSNVWLTATNGDILARASISATNDIMLSAWGNLITSNALTAHNGNLSMTGATVRIVDALEATLGDISIHATNGSFVVSNNLTAGRNLDVTANGALSVTTNGIITAGSNLTFTGDTIAISNSLTAGGDIMLTTTSTTLVATATALAISNNLTAGRDISLLSASGGMSILGDLTAASNITVTATTGNITNLCVVSAGQDIIITAGGLMTNTVQRHGAGITAGRDITISATGTIRQVASNIHAGRDIMMTAAAFNSRSNDLTADTGNIIIRSGGGINTSNMTAGGNIDLLSTAEVINLGSILASNSIRLEAAGSVSFKPNQTVTAKTGSVYILSGAHAPIKPITAGGDVTIIAQGRMELDNIVAGGNLLVQSITNNVEFNRPVVVTSNITAIAASNVVMSRNGMVTSTTGDIYFEAENAIGMTNKLTALTGGVTLRGQEVRLARDSLNSNNPVGIIAGAGGISIQATNNVTLIDTTRTTGTLDIVAGGDITVTNGGIDAATLGRITGSNVALNITTAGRDVGFGLIAATNRLELTAATIGGPSGATGFYDANGDALNLYAGDTALLNIGGYFGTLADPMEVSIAGHVEIDSAGLTANNTPKGYIFVVYNQTDPLPVSWKYIGNSQPGEIIINGVRKKDDPVVPPPSPEPTINPADYWRMMSALSFVQDTPVIRTQTADVGKAFFLHSDLPLSNEYVLGLVQYLQSTGSRITVSRTAREMDAYNRWGISNWLKDYTIPPAGLPYENTLDFLPEASAPVEQLASTSL